MSDSARLLKCDAGLAKIIISCSAIDRGCCCDLIGSALTAQSVRFFVNYILRITFSLDGPPKTRIETGNGSS